MQVESLFNESIKKIEYDKTTAIALFEKINFFLNKKMLDAMLDEELRVFALSNMHLFLITGIEDGKYADKALEAFELIIKRKKETLEIYEAYILILELTYQYEKSYDLLISLLHDSSTKKLALKFLSSYTYCAEKLQKFSDFISYKKELINITNDTEEKKKLQNELEIYVNK